MVETARTSRKTQQWRLARRRRTCTGGDTSRPVAAGLPVAVRVGRDPPRAAVDQAPHPRCTATAVLCTHPDVPGASLTPFAFGGPQVSKPDPVPSPSLPAASGPDSVLEPLGVAPPAWPFRGTAHAPHCSRSSAPNPPPVPALMSLAAVVLPSPWGLGSPGVSRRSAVGLCSPGAPQIHARVGVCGQSPPNTWGAPSTSACLMEGQ